MSPLILSPTGMFLLSPPPLLPLLSFLYSGMRRFEEETCELMDGGKVKLELAGFYQAVEVRKVNELVVYVAALCFGGALGEPTINLDVDCSEDDGNEGGIVGTLGFVGGEIGGNLWLPRFEAYGKQIFISKK